MKTLITHMNPHLDDICAIWLYKKFFPVFQNAEVKFLLLKGTAVTYQDKPVDSDPEVIHFGVGRGIYDEHKGDVNDCATSLVWKDIKEKNLVPKDDIDLASYEEIVEWSRLIDLGRFPEVEYGDFNVQAFIRPKDDLEESSLKAQYLGEEILDRILIVLRRKHQAIKDWSNKIEFNSKFGRSFAISSEFVDRAFCKSQGGDLFIMYDPKKNSVQYFTPSHETDLEPLYQKVKLLDPEADWFLHQSHHMVMCGGQDPSSQKTKLSFDQLIEVAKSL